MPDVIAYVAVIVIGTLVTLVANVPARKISLRIGYTAQPDARKVHQVVTPYGGGAAMLVGSDPLLVEARRLGGTGSVTAMANISS